MVYERDPATGSLTYQSYRQDGVGGVDGLDGVNYATVSPDGVNVYATSARDDAVAVFSRDAVTGALTYVEAVTALNVNGLEDPLSISVSHNGFHVYVAGSEDNVIVVFDRSPLDGSLSSAGLVEMPTNSANVMGMPMRMVLDPGDRHVYATSSTFDIDAVEIFHRSPNDGTLANIQSQLDKKGLEQTVGIAASSSGCFYTTSNGEDAVAFFSRDKGYGTLIYHGRIADTWYQDGLSGARAVVVSPDGRHVYVAGHDDDSVVFLEQTGTDCNQLDYVTRYTSDGFGVNTLDGVQGLALSPDGGFLYAAGAVADTLSVFERNGSTGELSHKQYIPNSLSTVDGLGGAYAVAVSPDGVNVYVAGYNDDAVAVFYWESDLLLYKGIARDGDFGVDGLDGANGVTVSPDDSQLYVASQHDNALAVFSRDADDGSLSFVTAHRDGVDGVDGLDIANSIAVSPDGGHVYVGSYGDDGVSVFRHHKIFSGRQLLLFLPPIIGGAVE